MPTISAANSLSIRIEGDAWKLFNGRSEDTLPIIEAKPGGLTYQPAFGAARRLSPNGQLPADQISMVVVGWAAEDTNWHLGVMLTPEIGGARGTRWCGLARWVNEDGDEAERAGRSLADTLGKSFKLVPPPSRPRPRIEDDDEPAPVVASAPELSASDQPTVPSRPTVHILPPKPVVQVETFAAPDVPLMPLPISMGEWLLRDNVLGLIWERSRGWRNETLLRAIFFGGLAVAFGALSAGSRLTVFAPVQPEWLPLVGLGVSLVMLILTVSQVLALLRAPTTLIDNRVRIMRQSSKGSRTVTQSPFEGIEYVLVSHMINRREITPAAVTEQATHDRILAEVWVHLFSPRRGFINLGYIGQIEGRARSGLKFEERQPLHLGDIETPAHHAAMIVAREIGIPTYIEQRG